MDETEEFENHVSRLLAALHEERKYLPEDALEHVDWLEEWFDARN